MDGPFRVSALPQLPLGACASWKPIKSAEFQKHHRMRGEGAVPAMLLQRPSPVYCGGRPCSADATYASSSELDAPPPDEHRNPVAMLDIVDIGLAQREQFLTSCTYAAAARTHDVPDGTTCADPLLTRQDNSREGASSASSRQSHTPHSGFIRQLQSWFARTSR
ncbi:LAQU0S04e05622g1_1 [Lachancea quebecensis]|uniref:LAQU0S04e05622g1_1 n=1 Tax=Lachancea quebecensis TaxID=1654605 RepID=A0A0P1KQQ2_9SACH|nr:LAQU0S04e05622g1_1 [Lachancea quebecensis]